MTELTANDLAALYYIRDFGVANSSNQGRVSLQKLANDGYLRAYPHEESGLLTDYALTSKGIAALAAHDNPPTVTPVTPLPGAAGDDDPLIVEYGDGYAAGYADGLKEYDAMQAELATLRDRNRHLEVVYQMAVSMDAQTDMLESLFSENIEAWAELSVALDELRATHDHAANG